MTKTLSMVSHKEFNFSANEGFVIFLTFKFNCFIDGYTLKMKSQSIFYYLLSGSEHIYWILDFESELHLMWNLWISDLQEYKGNGFFEVEQADISFRSGPKKYGFLFEGLPLPK